MKEGMLKKIQNVDNIVPKGVWGGEGTRDILAQRDFLEANGYNYDGNIWKKNC
jgi:hypothetical protein